MSKSCFLKKSWVWNETHMLSCLPYFMQLAVDIGGILNLYTPKQHCQKGKKEVGEDGLKKMREAVLKELNECRMGMHKMQIHLQEEV